MKRQKLTFAGMALSSLWFFACGTGTSSGANAANAQDAADDAKGTNQHVGHVEEPPAMTSGEQNPVFTVTAAPHPSAKDVEYVLVTPSAEERAAGGEEVKIIDSISIGHWTESVEFFPMKWEKNFQGLKARYRVSFQGEGGEISAFFLGTTKDSAIEPKCFGLCAHWWVAPALQDGTQDMANYHVMSEDLWHPLAREWYYSH